MLETAAGHFSVTIIGAKGGSATTELLGNGTHAGTS